MCICITEKKQRKFHKLTKCRLFPILAISQENLFTLNNKENRNIFSIKVLGIPEKQYKHLLQWYPQVDIS